MSNSSESFLKLKKLIEELKIEIEVKEEELMNYKEILNHNEVKLIRLCEKEGGHYLKREVEDGPYGETFYICKRCGYTSL